MKIHFRTRKREPLLSKDLDIVPQVGTFVFISPKFYRVKEITLYPNIKPGVIGSAVTVILDEN